MDGQTRRSLFQILAGAVVREAIRQNDSDETPGWIEPFFGWDAVLCDGDFLTVGTNGDYEDFLLEDAQDAMQALVSGWSLSADADIVDGVKTQDQIDNELIQAVQRYAGILVI